MARLLHFLAIYISLIHPLSFATFFNAERLEEVVFWLILSVLVIIYPFGSLPVVSCYPGFDQLHEGHLQAAIAVEVVSRGLSYTRRVHSLLTLNELAHPPSPLPYSTIKLYFLL